MPITTKTVTRAATPRGIARDKQVGQRPGQGDEEHRDEERHDQNLEVPQQPQQAVDEDGEDDQPPAPLRGEPNAIGQPNCLLVAGAHVPSSCQKWSAHERRHHAFGMVSHRL